MLMRFMGPCSSSVFVPPERALAADRDYLQAWQEFKTSAKNALDACFDAEDRDFPHTREALAKRPVRYESVTDDTPILPAYVFRSQVIIEDRVEEIREAAVARLRELQPKDNFDDLSKNVKYIPGSAQLRLYYGGIMIVWFELAVDQAIKAAGDVPEAQTDALDKLERFGVAWTQELAKRVDECLVKSFRDPRPGMPWRILTTAGETDRAATLETVRAGTALADFFNLQESARGLAFWVTRSVIVDSETRENSEYMQIWLKPVRANKELPEEGYSMTWLRYAFDLDKLASRTPTFEDAWESMLFSQFIWASLERVEFRMFRMLGHVDRASGTRALLQSHADLDNVREEAELTLVHHRHLMRYLTRERFRLVEQILEEWGFKALVENLDHVIAFARARHEQLLQRTAARSSVFTDLLLFSIGSVAVVNFFVSISITGRRLASESGIGRRDEGRFDIFGWLSDSQMDHVLFAAVIVIGVAFVALAWAKGRQIPSPLSGRRRGPARR